MNSHTELVPNIAPAINSDTFKQRLSSICYLTAITVATVGWLTAWGWAADAVANWLLA
jgi:hypothetical protein